jgi:exopolyphosphatase / guanosine-5'-triphosphate,3'-diphosphate pyrophosphatase
MRTGGSKHNRESFTARFRRTEKWIARALGGIRHEHRVIGISLSLFDLLQESHGLDRKYRRRLKIGALLHDAGRRCGARKHHISGAKWIERTRSVPLRPGERHMAAFLARYHRGQLPSDSEVKSLFGAAEAETATILLGLLRAADALDSRRLSEPGVTLRLRGRELQVRCYVEGDLQEAEDVLAHRKKFRLLKQTLQIRVNVEIRPFSSPVGACR